MNGIHRALVELKQTYDQVNKQNNPQIVYGFMEGYVLKYGIEMNMIGECKRMMEPKQCFNNALTLAIDEDLIYVEGYGLSVIPILHAWCINSEGEVIDPTWREEICERSYMGIPFQTTFVVRTVMKNDQASIIDDWKNRWPVAREQVDPSEYLHPIYETLKNKCTKCT